MSNWDAWPEAGDLTGSETGPCNQGGVSKWLTINKIVAFLGSVFDAVGTAASAIATHLTMVDHDPITHSNRSALDLVSGTNTGDQDLSGLATTTDLGLKANAANPTLTGTPKLNGVDISATAADINRLTGSRDNIQTQIDTKAPLAAPQFTGDIWIDGVRIGLGGGVFTTNAIFGINAGISNTTGEFLVAIGKNALAANTTGSNQIAIGPSALAANTTGASNVAIGSSALAVNTTGNLNQAIGYMALALNTIGSGNTALGYTALANNTTGFNNIGIGTEALGSMTTGAHNVGIGYQAGAFDAASGLNLTGTYSVCIGFDARPKTNGETNEIVIGYFARGAGSNTATLGSTNIVKTVLQGEVKCPGLSTGITTQTGATYTVPVTVTSIVANYAGTMTLTLPSAATYPGRIFTIKTIQAQSVVSAAADVVPLAGGTAGTGILAATAGKFAQLQSDGTSWQIMMAN